MKYKILFIILAIILGGIGSGYSILTKTTPKEEVTVYYWDIAEMKAKEQQVQVEEITPEAVLQALTQPIYCDGRSSILPKEMIIKEVDIDKTQKTAKVYAELEESLRGNYSSSAYAEAGVYSIVTTLLNNEVFDIEKVILGNTFVDTYGIVGNSYYTLENGEREVTLISEIMVSDLTFGQSYKEVVDKLGVPFSTAPITDEATVVNKGHFVILEYLGLECIVNTRSNELEDTSSIVEITVTGENYYTPRIFNVGSQKEHLKKAYNLEEEDFVNKNNSDLLDRIQGLRREDNTVPDYEEMCVIREDENPVALFYLLKEDRVVAILIRHLSAD